MISCLQVFILALGRNPPKSGQRYTGGIAQSASVILLPGPDGINHSISSNKMHLTLVNEETRITLQIGPHRNHARHRRRRVHVAGHRTKGSRRNNFTFWREGRCSIMNRFLFAKHAEDYAPSGCGPQARWLCCSLLTYRAGYASSLAPRQRTWGPAAECELISARTLMGRIVACGTNPCDMAPDETARSTSDLGPSILNRGANT